MSGPGHSRDGRAVGGSLAVKSAETLRGDEPPRLQLISANLAWVRIPTKSITHSDGNRSAVPTETGHPWPLYGSNRLRATGGVAARDVPSVVPWSSWKVECRDAPSSHPGGQTPACADERRGRTERFDDGSPDSAGARRRR